MSASPELEKHLKAEASDYRYVLTINQVDFVVYTWLWVEYFFARIEEAMPNDIEKHAVGQGWGALVENANFTIAIDNIQETHPKRLAKQIVVDVLNHRRTQLAYYQEPPYEYLEDDKSYYIPILDAEECPTTDGEPCPTVPSCPPPSTVLEPARRAFWLGWGV